jgi:hypothetical protein
MVTSELSGNGMEDKNSGGREQSEPSVAKGFSSYQILYVLSVSQQDRLG